MCSAENRGTHGGRGNDGVEWVVYGGRMEMEMGKQ